MVGGWGHLLGTSSLASETLLALQLEASLSWNAMILDKISGIHEALCKQKVEKNYDETQPAMALVAIQKLVKWFRHTIDSERTVMVTT